MLDDEFWCPGCDEIVYQNGFNSSCPYCGSSMERLRHSREIAKDREYNETHPKED